MAAEYLAIDGNYALNTPINFNASIPCTSGYVYHEDGDGIFILRGIVNNACAKYATYKLRFNGNIAVPTGGTVGPIAVAIVVNGEPRLGSRSISTPAAVEEYNAVTSSATIKLPRGCCVIVAVEPVSGLVNDPTGTPAPVIAEVNGNFEIARIA